MPFGEDGNRIPPERAAMLRELLGQGGSADDIAAEHERRLRASAAKLRDRIPVRETPDESQLMGLLEKRWNQSS